MTKFTKIIRASITGVNYVNSEWYEFETDKDEILNKIFVESKDRWYFSDFPKSVQSVWYSSDEEQLQKALYDKVIWYLIDYDENNEIESISSRMEAHYVQ